MRLMRAQLVAASLVLTFAFLTPVSAGEVAVPLVAGAPQVQATAVPEAHGPAWPAGASSGKAAVETLGTRLPDVARRQGWTAERLTETLLSDPTLHVDATDRLFYAETAPPAAGLPAQSNEAALPEGAAPYPLANTFALHSLPGANLTILLDFGPRTMSGNAWTASKNGGSDIACPAWSLDGDPAFSDAEKTAIQEIWQRVAEDYAPFNVDVTTQFTTEAAITRSSWADNVYGTRVLVSPISSYFGKYGGIAYISVFNDVGDYYKPALVFPEWLGNSPKSIAEAASHEAGHNLNLGHDGAAGVEYYQGSGSGQTGWAPIMGSGYYQNLSQWSRGEYSGANNQEDDLDIIEGYLGYRNDDADGTTDDATGLPASTTLSASGLVGSSSDVDVYSFSAGAGGAVIDVAPAVVGPNLDLSVEVRDAGGSLVVSDNPVGELSAHLIPNLSAGTYYLFVRGTGKGSPAASGGYSSYASIGRYTVSGTVQAPAAPAPGTLVGAVSAWGGGALSGVTVSVPGTATVGTAVDGSYTVAGITPGTYMTTYSKSGYTSQSVSVTIASGATTTRNIVLAPAPPTPGPGALAGTVSASGGGALSGATVSVPGTATVTTAADGTYALAGITPGTYTATYSKSGYTGQSVSVTISSEATTTQDMALAPVPATPTTSPVYRFFNKSNGSHFYTASVAEKDTVLATFSATYSLDGPAYRVSSAFGTPLHRFFNRSNGSHFYTASESEKEFVIANLSAMYTYDGIAYKVSASPVAGSTPVYRFFNKSNGSHFYTASLAEKNAVLANLSATYGLDGVAFHVIP